MSIMRQQMSRYPVFSCGQILLSEQFDTFKDEGMKSRRKDLIQPQLYNRKRNNKITNIYNKIINNNTKDPLYPRSEPQSVKQQFRTSKVGKPERAKQRTVDKFVEQLVTSIASEKDSIGEDKDHSYQQKINLLKRIIEHYNCKHIAKDNYNSLIKTFGLRIDEPVVQNIAMKKSLHPRQKLRISNVKTAQNSKRSPRNSSYQKTIQPQISTKKQQTRIGYNNSFVSIGSQFLDSPQQRKFVDQKFATFQSANKAQNTGKMFNIQAKKRIINTEHSIKLRSAQRSQNVIPFPRNDSLDNLEKKISKYRQFLFILNLSNNFYKDLDVQKYEQNFKFYVGPGNNGSIIKALMKRRFWFQETKNISEADFVWTQLKVEQIFQRQKSCKSNGQQQKQQKEYMLQQGVINSESQKPCSPFQNQLGQGKQEIASLKPSNINRRSIKKIDQNDAVTRVASNKHTQQYYNMLESMPRFKQKQTFGQRIKYIEKQIKTVKQSCIIHNHLNFNGFLGNKKAMFYSLRQYCRATSKNLNQFIPLTFHIKKGYLDQDFKAFMTVYLQQKKAKKPNVWIMKPGQFSNRGQGISCSSKIQQIRKRVAKCKNSKNAQMNKPSTLIIQSYITNPLLYNHRKFDIRVFMLITSHNGKLKGYWYQEGYIRTSSFVWSLHQFEDSLVHLTNDAIQKTCYEYGKYETANKLSFSEFQRYLDSLPPNGRNMDFLGSIFPKMKQIGGHAIKATFPYLDPNKYVNNFEVFGLDFMIDDRMKPWLIQVNTNPCLQINCPVLQRVIPHLLQNALRIAIDPLFVPPSNYSSTYKYNIPENALHYNKFELIFDEERDGPSLLKLYDTASFVKSMDDIEQDKQQFQDLESSTNQFQLQQF